MSDEYDRKAAPMTGLAELFIQAQEQAHKIMMELVAVPSHLLHQSACCKASIVQYGEAPGDFECAACGNNTWYDGKVITS